MHPDAEFSVEVTAFPGGVVVAPKGELDLATVEKVGAACADADGTLVLDLRCLVFMDTSGLHLVVDQQRRAEERGRRFAVVRAPKLQRLFDIAGLNHRLPFVEDPDEVVADGRPAA